MTNSRNKGASFEREIANALNDYLELKKPIYQDTASYGHFGRDIFNWEKIDLSL